MANTLKPLTLAATLFVTGCGTPDDRPTAKLLCGEIPRPNGQSQQTAMLTSFVSGFFPDSDLHVVWFCRNTHSCDPVFSFNQSAALAAHWAADGALEIVSTATEPKLWPAQSSFARAWPKVRVTLIEAELHAPPLEASFVNAGTGRVLRSSESCKHDPQLAAILEPPPAPRR